MRADYNIVFSFLLVILLWKDYFQDEKYYLKIIIHVSAVLCIVDIIWLIICMPSWTNGETKNEFWNNLHGMHWFVVLLAFIEFGIKIGIAYFSYEIFKVKYKNEIGYLTTFEYGKTARNLDKV
jgi:hypothetical protein